MKTRRLLPLFAVLAFGCADVAAQTLYKLIDKNGKITYSEKPPKDFDGKVVPMTIDPNANTATLPKLKLEEKPANNELTGSDAKEGGKRAPKSTGNKVQDARDNLARAKKAYQDAVDNPGEGEVSRVGNKNGTARAVFSESYQARISSLEAAVKQAEEELRRAEGG